MSSAPARAPALYRLVPMPKDRSLRLRLVSGDEVDLRCGLDAIEAGRFNQEITQRCTTHPDDTIADVDGRLHKLEDVMWTETVVDPDESVDRW